MAEKKSKHEHDGDVPWTWDEDRNKTLPKCWYIDESAQRTDRTEFPTLDEAKEIAFESARILGRGISVYKVDYEQHADEHVGRMLPDGTFEKGDNLLTQPGPSPSTKTPDSTVMIGSLVRRVAEVLRRRGDVTAAEQAEHIVPEHSEPHKAEPRIPNSLLQLTTLLNRVLHVNPTVPGGVGQRATTIGQRALLLFRGLNSDLRRIQTVDRERGNRIQLLCWLIELLLNKLEAELH